MSEEEKGYNFKILGKDIRRYDLKLLHCIEALHAHVTHSNDGLHPLIAQCYYLFLRKRLKYWHSYEGGWGKYREFEKGIKKLVRIICHEYKSSYLFHGDRRVIEGMSDATKKQVFQTLDLLSTVTGR